MEHHCGRGKEVCTRSWQVLQSLPETVSLSGKKGRVPTVSDLVLS